MSDIRETKEITEFKDVIKGYKCDGCGKIVDGKELPKDWFGFSSGHEGWGNDSVDSIEYHDVCSPRCFIVVAEKVLEDLKGYENSAEIADMPYAFAKNLVEAFKTC